MLFGSQDLQEKLSETGKYATPILENWDVQSTCVDLNSFGRRPSSRYCWCVRFFCFNSDAL